MARTGLGYEEVAAAAERISMRGERVSLRSVRAELGTGSLTTISRHLDEYQGAKTRVVAHKVDAALELPPKIVEAILAEIEAQKNGVQEELSGLLETLKADNQSLTAELDRLTQECEVLQNDQAKADGRASALADQLEKERTARIEAENALRQVREELSAQTARTENAQRLQADVDRLRLELIDEREKRHAAELEALRHTPAQHEAPPKPKAKEPRAHKPANTVAQQGATP